MAAQLVKQLKKNLANIFVYFYGGKWTHYIDLEYLSIENRDWINEMITYCDLYKRETKYLKR